MNDHVSVLTTTKRLLDSYLASVRESPDKVSDDSEDLAYAIIYLVNRYAEEFECYKWIKIFINFSAKIGEIKTRYPDMVVFQAPLWCCMYRLERSECYIKDVLSYGLSQMSMGRSIFLNYTYLIRSAISYQHLLYYVRWYCREGKFCMESLLYIFMNSHGSQEDKLMIIDGLHKDPGYCKFPQVPQYFELYLNHAYVENPFTHVDQYATNTILDFIISKDLAKTKQLEIDLSEEDS